MPKLRKHLMSDEEYKRHDGSRCPFCESDDIEGGAMDAGGRDAGQEVSCTACGAVWWDIYKLYGYDVRHGPNEEREQNA